MASHPAGTPESLTSGAISGTSVLQLLPCGTEWNLKRFSQKMFPRSECFLQKRFRFRSVLRLRKRRHHHTAGGHLTPCDVIQQEAWEREAARTLVRSDVNLTSDCEQRSPGSRHFGSASLSIVKVCHFRISVIQFWLNYSLRCPLNHLLIRILNSH